MANKRYSRIHWTANIQGGDYPMSGLLAPALKEGAWRVVAIPGTPSRDHVFYRFLAKAPEDMEVAMVSRAGYGPKTGEPVLDFDEQVRSIAPLFTKDDGRKTIILGVSYGGALSLKCALDYPDHIVGALTVAMLVNEPRAYVRASLPLALLPGIKQILPKHLHNARQEVAGRRAQIGPLFDRLKTLDIPVTILHGDADTLVPLQAAHDLKAHFTEEQDVQFSLVKRGSHYLECERPNRLYEEIEGLKARIEQNV